MRDAIGGVFNFMIIFVFIALVSGFLAFNIGYSKAFRVKNKLIDLIEKNEGYTNEVKEEIVQYSRNLGYSPGSIKKKVQCNKGALCCPDGLGFCYQNVDASTESYSNDEHKCYYNVITIVDIDIPILKSFIPEMEAFKVKGNTITMDCSM